MFNTLEAIVNESSLVSYTDRDGLIVKANKKFCDISGYSEEELIGKNHKILNSNYHNNDFWKNMYDTCDKGEIWYGLVRNINKNGDYYWVQTHVQGLYYTNELIGYMSVRHLVTDLIEKQTIIEKKNSLMSHVAYSVRHDMRNLLTIYLPVSIKKLKKQHPEDTKSIEKIYEQLRKVYDGIYEFSNLLKPNQDIDLKEIDLGEILNQYFKHTIYFKNLNIKLNNFKIIVSPNMFCQGIDNLVKNGIKYNDNKNKDKIIDIYNSGDDIIIKDNGIGMNHKDFLALSKPWVRGDSKESGTGLGLYISNEIFKVNKYEIIVRKQKNGKGTIIKLKKIYD